METQCDELSNKDESNLSGRAAVAVEHPGIEEVESHTQEGEHDEAMTPWLFRDAKEFRGVCQSCKHSYQLALSPDIPRL